MPPRFPNWFLMTFGALVMAIWTGAYIKLLWQGDPVDPFLNALMFGLGGTMFGVGFFRKMNGTGR